MPAGRTQLAAKGLQDDYLSGTPKMSFFKTMFVNHTPFFIKAKEIPVNGSGVTFNTTQVCEITLNGDIIRSITLKVTLPSMFYPSYGVSYPVKSTDFTPSIYFMDINFSILYSASARDNILYYNNSNTCWLPPNITIGTDRFNFTSTSSSVVYFAFSNVEDAIFWGFKNEITYVNNYYIYNFSPYSQLSFINSGWVNAYYPYFRYYSPKAGINILKFVELYIGGQLIESVPREYIIIHDDIDIKNNQQASLSKLHGDFWQPSMAPSTFYIKVPFSMSNIPIVALTRQNVDVKINTVNFLDVVDSNAYNVTNFSNIVDFNKSTVTAAITDGINDYFLVNNNILSYTSNLGTNLLANAAVPSPGTPLSMTLASSYIYLMDLENVILYQYNTISNTFNTFECKSCANFAPTVAMVAGSNNTDNQPWLFSYTNAGSVQKIDYTYDPDLTINNLDFNFPKVQTAYEYNNFCYIGTISSIVIQNLKNPTLFTENTDIVYKYGAPIQFSARDDIIYYITPNNLMSYNIETLSYKQLYTFTIETPKLITNVTDKAVINANANLYYYFYETQTVTVTGVQNNSHINAMTAADLYWYPYSIYYADAEGGLKFFDTSDTAIYYQAVEVDPSNIYTSIITSPGYAYCGSPTALNRFSLWIPFPPEIIDYRYIGEGTTHITAYSYSTGKIYFSNDGINIKYALDDNNFYIYSQPTTKPPSLSGYSNLYYDGIHIYAFPSDSSSYIYRYNTNQDFLNPAAHQTNLILDSSSNQKTLAVGSVVTDGTTIYAFPLFDDSNIITYDTTLSFNLPSSYTVTNIGSFVTRDNYNNAILFQNQVLFSSSSQIFRMNIRQPGNTFLSTNILPRGAATVCTCTYNQNGTVYMFNSNLANAVITTSTQTGDAINLTNVGNFPQYKSNIFNVTVQSPNNDFVYLIPSNCSNLLVYSMTQNTIINDYSNPNKVPNNSNTACLVGTKLYMFPWNQQNTFVFDTITSTFSKLDSPITGFSSSTYDNLQYVYLTNGTSNVIRFNTKLDEFTDYAGYSTFGYGPSNVLSFPQRSFPYRGNIYVISSTNLFSINIFSNIVSQPFMHNGKTIPVMSRQNISDTVSWSTNSNLYIFYTNKTVSNLITTPISERGSGVIRNIIDMTSNESNLYLSWSDNTLGVLNLSSNDFNGVFNFSEINSRIYGNINSSTVLNGNLYTITSDNVSVTNLMTFVVNNNRRIPDTLSPPIPSNTYNTTLTLKSNLYMFPLTGNVIVQMVDGTNSMTRIKCAASNITSVVTRGNYIYIASRVSNVMVQYDTTKSFGLSSSFIKYIQTSTLANSFSNSFYNSVDDNIYFLPYLSNSIISYNVSNGNFANISGLTSLSVSMSNTISSYSVGRYNYLLSGDGYLQKVFNGVLSTSVIDLTSEMSQAYHYSIVSIGIKSILEFVRSGYTFEYVFGVIENYDSTNLTNYLSVVNPGYVQSSTFYVYVPYDAEDWNISLSPVNGGKILAYFNDEPCIQSSLCFFVNFLFYRNLLDSKGNPLAINFFGVYGYYTDSYDLQSNFNSVLRELDVYLDGNQIGNIVSLSLNQSNTKFKLFTNPSAGSVDVSGLSTLGFHTDSQTYSGSFISQNNITELVLPINSNGIFSLPSGTTRGMYRLNIYTDDSIGTKFNLSRDGYYSSNKYYLVNPLYNGSPSDAAQGFNVSNVVPQIVNGCIFNDKYTSVVKLKSDGTYDINYYNYSIRPLGYLGQGVSNVYSSPNYIYLLTDPYTYFNGEYTTGTTQDIVILNSDYPSYDRAIVIDGLADVITHFIGFNASFAYQLFTDGSVFQYKLGTNIFSLGFKIPFSNVIGTNLSFPLADGLCFVQSSIYGANLNAVNQNFCISYDYNSLNAYELQYYSYVKQFNGFTYLSPGQGNVIASITTSATVSSFSSDISFFDVTSLSSLFIGHTYNIFPVTNQSNIYFIMQDTNLGVSNIIQFNTSKKIWSITTAKYGGFTSNTATVTFDNKILIPSSINSSCYAFNLSQTFVNPYSEYIYPQSSILSNVSFVSQGSVYLLPGIGSTSFNIIPFNLSTYKYSTVIPHDRAVLDTINVNNYQVIINNSKINVFSLSSMVSVATVNFTNPTGIVYSKAFDGRYLTLFTPYGVQSIDFNWLTSPPLILKSNIAYSSVVYNGNIYAANNITHLNLGYYPKRGYNEVSAANATGLVSFKGNLYAKVSGGAINRYSGDLSNPSLVYFGSTNILNDSLVIDSNIVFLTSDTVMSMDVSSGTINWQWQNPGNFTKQLIYDGSSNIYVESSTSLDIARFTSSGYTFVSSVNIYAKSVGVYTSAWYAKSNLYLMTNTNEGYFYNPYSIPFYTNPIQQITSYGVYNNNSVYLLPGSNTSASQVQVYNTFLPFAYPTSYSNIYTGGYNDLRTSVIDETTLYCVGYYSANIIAINLSTSNVVAQYTIDVSDNVCSNTYNSVVYDGSSFFLTTYGGSNLARVYKRNLITSQSFNNTIQVSKEENPIKLLNTGNQLLYITSSNVYSFDMLDTSKYSMNINDLLFTSPYPIGPAFYDGRFIKMFNTTEYVYDTIPLDVTPTLAMSCVVDYAYLTNKEKNWLRNSILDYRIDQIQTTRIDINKTSGFYKLDLTNPTKEFFMTVDTGEIYNIELFLNGYSKSLLSNTYTYELNNYLYHLRTPTNTVVHTYSFAGNNNGYINMSRIKEQIIYIETSDVCQFTLYSISNNIIRIKDGLGGVMFKTRER